MSNDDLDGEAQQTFDAVSHLQASRRQPRSAAVFIRSLSSALRLSRRASPRLANLNLALQFAAVALLGLQILFAKLALEAIFDQADSGGSIAEVLPSLVGVVATTGLAGLATSAQAQLQRLLGEQVQRDVLSSILKITTSVPLETFESPHFFDDLQRVQTNAGTQPSNLASSLVSLIGGALGVAILAVALFAIEPLLVPVLLVGGIPQAFLARRQGSIEFDFIVGQSHGHRIRNYLLEVLTGREEAKEIRAFDLGQPVERRWERSYGRYIDDLRAHVTRRVRLAMLGSLVTFVVTAGALALLVALVLDDRVSLASAGAALIAIRLMATRIEMTFSGVTGLFEATLFLQDYERFLQREPERRPAAHARDANVEPFQDLRAEDLHFRYPGSEVDALRGISFDIRAGEVVALVGENGSGKTTLAKLLCHVFSPTGGRILWDGTDTAALPPEAVRRHVGVIFQDFVRYQLTAHENIAFGRAEADHDRDGVIAAAEQGGAHDFLSRLPQGYDTLLGKTFWGGYDLSLGQWQRVAIARAIFRQASFLVLDEPTASLDARSEQRLFEQLMQLAEGRALLLISHRFSTVRAAHRIFVLQEGRLTEHGSHEELMAAGGHYAELFTLQAKSYG